jgi:hypothetical protein
LAPDWRISGLLQGRGEGSLLEHHEAGSAILKRTNIEHSGSRSQEF